MFAFKISQKSNTFCDRTEKRIFEMIKEDQSKGINYCIVISNSVVM